MPGQKWFYINGDAYQSLVTLKSPELKIAFVRTLYLIGNIIFI